MRSRLARLRQEMRDHGLDAFLLSSLPNIRYLTGFSGSNALCVVTDKVAVLITDSRYARQSALEARRCRRVITSRDPFDAMAADGMLTGRRTLGFEARHLSYAHYRSLKRLFPRRTLVGTVGTVEELTLVKEPAEVQNIRRAARISDKVFLEILSLIRPGVTEADIAAEISYRQRMHGGEGDAFAPIVAGGERAVRPHAHPTRQKIRHGDLVVLDFGTTIGGYCSDLTRTVAVGKASPRARELYGLVRQAHAAAMAAARGGIPARDLDAAARALFHQAGLGKFFVHSLGHGLGLSIHERPRVSPLSKEQLQSGSVITIEPGLYVPGTGGVRIEDDVLLTRTGCTVLTRAPREMMIL